MAATSLALLELENVQFDRASAPSFVGDVYWGSRGTFRRWRKHVDELTAINKVEFDQDLIYFCYVCSLDPDHEWTVDDLKEADSFALEHGRLTQTIAWRAFIDCSTENLQRQIAAPSSVVQSGEHAVHSFGQWNVRLRTADGATWKDRIADTIHAAQAITTPRPLRVNGLERYRREVIQAG